MNRYFLLAAAVSIAVAGPLPDLQWQDNNDGLVAFVPESPSTLYQDALGLNLPVQDTKWITAEQPSSENRGGKGNNDGIDPSRSSTAKDDNDEDGDEHQVQPGASTTFNDPRFSNYEIPKAPPVSLIFSTPSNSWIIQNYKCKDEASVCCSQENRLGPGFKQIPSTSKSCAASTFFNRPPNNSFFFVALSKLSREIYILLLYGTAHGLIH